MQGRVQSASDLDINIKDPQELPTDTVSSISWTPSGNNTIFATSDWASYIRIYNLDPDSLTLTQQACFDAQSPCLSVKWHDDEKTVFTGCTDGSIKLYDIASGNFSEIGRHEGPVKSVHWLSEANALLTLSFDKAVGFWDPRQAEAAAVYRLNYKPFCSDVMYPYLAIGISEAKYLVVDLPNVQAALERNVRYRDSPLGVKTQITSIKIYKNNNNKMGFAIGGNDTRCNVSHFADSQQVFDKLDTVITFKAHKLKDSASSAYPVNCLGFHPHLGSQFMYTCGGDGQMLFWDLKQKNKIGTFDFQGVPVNQAEIDPTGKYMAYALGYDWARGVGGYMSQPSKVCVHVVKDNELTYQGQFFSYPEEK